jgi:hypothetical protein
MGFEDAADDGGIPAGVKPEVWEQLPEAAPAAGEDAGPRCDLSIQELDKDVDQTVVRKRGEAVLAAAVAAIRELR